MPRSSETRTERLCEELLAVRGWVTSKPPRGHLLWKTEYKSYPELNAAFRGRSKGKGTGYGVPDFMLLGRDGRTPLVVGEAKADVADLGLAVSESCDVYAEALRQNDIAVLAIAVAGSDESELRMRVSKYVDNKWCPVTYRDQPIEWAPSPEDAHRLLLDTDLLELRPVVPSPDVLADRANEINRILRECKIKDEFRPATIGAFMLALWSSRGQIRMGADHALGDINRECRTAFAKAGKPELADSISVPTGNTKLAGSARSILRILRLLNVTTLTAEHDYLGQLYETFFRFTGGNTIGQFFTPRHITSAMVDICGVSAEDRVIDPACGTGGFLISSLYKMMGNRQLSSDQIVELVSEHLEGFESEPITAALCVVNMILRGDGTTGVHVGDCFTHSEFPAGSATVCLGNPPFPHKKTDEPTESFLTRGLEALAMRGRMAMVVPSSLLSTGGKKAQWRNAILLRHSLSAVITLPPELFQPYASATTAIVVLEKGVPHDARKSTFFAHVEHDGFRLRKGIRRPLDGDQLEDVLARFRNASAEPGRCSWATLDEDEWSPGAYVESVPSSREDLLELAAGLLQNAMAFRSLHVFQLERLLEMLGRDEIEVRTHEEVVRDDQNPADYDEDTIGRLFYVQYGQTALESKAALQPGHCPVISSAGSDNGCHGFYELPEDAFLIDSPLVTIPRTGSIGEAFVQSNACAPNSDCIVLLPREGTDATDLLIAAAEIRRERWRFNYGRKITPGRIRNIRINRGEALKHEIKQLAIRTADAARLQIERRIL